MDHRWPGPRVLTSNERDPQGLSLMKFHVIDGVCTTIRPVRIRDIEFGLDESLVEVGGNVNLDKVTRV